MIKELKLNIETIIKNDNIITYLDVVASLDRIATITELTPEITDKPFPLFQMGEYDAETKRFFLSKSCPSEKENETFLVIIEYRKIIEEKEGVCNVCKFCGWSYCCSFDSVALSGREIPM